MRRGPRHTDQGTRPAATKAAGHAATGGHKPGGEANLKLPDVGTVKFFNTAKGFGFIQPEDGSKDVFIHISALERAGINGIYEGDKLSFVLEDDRKGRGKQAGQVQLV